MGRHGDENTHFAAAGQRPPAALQGLRMKVCKEPVTNNVTLAESTTCLLHLLTIYTTNTMESFHAQLRKIKKSKRVFSTDMALMKLLYLVQDEITKKWVMPLANWPETLSQFS
ncbi:MAG: transposase, partial [Bacteroidota bacterium]